MPSFDVVSKVDMEEVRNGLQMVHKEIANRYDFKGSKSSVELIENEFKIIADDDYKLEAVKDILLQRLNKRGISPKAFDMGKVESASGGLLRQMIKIVQGLDAEKCKAVNKFIKEMKIKVTGETHKDQLRITAKSRDDLQTVIAELRNHDFGVPLQFNNFRD